MIFLTFTFILIGKVFTSDLREYMKNTLLAGENLELGKIGPFLQAGGDLKELLSVGPYYKCSLKVILLDHFRQREDEMVSLFELFHQYNSFNVLKILPQLLDPEMAMELNIAHKIIDIYHDQPLIAQAALRDALRHCKPWSPTYEAHYNFIVDILNQKMNVLGADSYTVNRLLDLGLKKEAFALFSKDPYLSAEKSLVWILKDLPTMVCKLVICGYDINVIKELSKNKLFKLPHENALIELLKSNQDIEATVLVNLLDYYFTTGESFESFIYIIEHINYDNVSDPKALLNWILSMSFISPSNYLPGIFATNDSSKRLYLIRYLVARNVDPRYWRGFEDGECKLLFDMTHDDLQRFKLITSPSANGFSGLPKELIHHLMTMMLELNSQYDMK